MTGMIWFGYACGMAGGLCVSYIIRYIWRTWIRR